MNSQLSSVIIDSDPANRQELAKFLTSFGVTLTAQYPTLESLAPILSRSDAPQLAIINLDPGVQESLKKLAALPRKFSATSFFVMSQVLDPHVLMEAMHCGVKEFIALPINEQKFGAALERAAHFHGL